MKRLILRPALLLLLALVCRPAAMAQHFGNMQLPTDLCAGRTEHIQFGENVSDTCSSIQVLFNQVTLNHSERIFLPDGVSCGAMGCYYTSPITFNQFPQGSTITSVNDIEYLRINMEHSFIADIYISITCPSNQTADIVRFDGTANAACASSIPESSRHWHAGDNHSGAYLGVPSETDSYTNRCDTLANPAGTGWNYCWSNNTVSGYTYASDGGYIYRSSNMTSNGWTSMTCDSSNVAAGTQFYHPDQSFAALVGCPLNGNWSVRVQDGYSIDNGWLFEWELSLSTPALSGDSCTIAQRMIIGPGIEQISDSLFSLSVPADLEADTTIQYLIRIINSCGDTLDTLHTITFHHNYLFDNDEVVCDQVSINGIVYHDNAFIDYTFPTQHGCDSTYRMNLTVNHSDTTYETQELCHPYLWHDSLYSSSGRYRWLTRTTRNCDSLCLLDLTVHDPSENPEEITICASDLPFQYNDITFPVGTPTHQSVIDYTDQYGCDSVIILQLNVIDPPELSLEEVRYDCGEQLFELKATTDQDNIRWSAQPPDPYLVGQEERMNVLVRPGGQTIYSAVTEIPDLHCATTREIRVGPIVTLEASMCFNPGFATFARPNIELRDCSEGNVNSWLWTANGEVVGRNPREDYIYPVDEEQVDVRLIVTESRYQCRDTAYGTLFLLGGDLFVPNAFTPGRDDNSRFLPKGNNILNYEIDIYSRNGQRVYYSVDLHEGWDGNNLRGKPCPQDTYVYRIRYSLREAPRNPIVLKGNVLLIR